MTKEAKLVMYAEPDYGALEAYLEVPASMGAEGLAAAARRGLLRTLCDVPSTVVEPLRRNASLGNAALPAVDGSPMASLQNLLEGEGLDRADVAAALCFLRARLEEELSGVSLAGAFSQDGDDDTLGQKKRLGLLGRLAAEHGTVIGEQPLD